MTGRGAGLSDEGLKRKVKAIETALALHQPDPEDAIDILSKVGGFDLAGLCGLALGAALCRIPVLLDGLISCAAALLAVKLCPAAGDYLLASHLSAEPAGWPVLNALGVQAPGPGRHAAGRGHRGRGRDAHAGYGHGGLPRRHLRRFADRGLYAPSRRTSDGNPGHRRLRLGESAYAEGLVLESPRRPRVYAAAMEPFGQEARRRIERHRQLRAGKGFETWELPGRRTTGPSRRAARPSWSASPP